MVSVLTVHHLDAEGKRDLFRQVREQSRALVVGDVVEVEPERQVTPLEDGVDLPSRRPTRRSGAAVRSSGKPTTWRSSAPCTTPDAVSFCS